MKLYIKLMFFIIIGFIGSFNMVHSTQFIPPNNPNIQYFGRWDTVDSLHYKHSWPGIYIRAEFKGKRIGVRMADSINYYNVYIDGKLHRIFHGIKSGDADYILADSLQDAPHTLILSKRNIVFDVVFSFSGLLLDDDAQLFPPVQKPARKIEFIGDSFTAGESNEATEQQLVWEARFPVTNIDKGFAPIIACHYNAQYHTICRSGMGLTCDWQGKPEFSMLKYFDRTLMESPTPKWDFKKWIPDLVIICLGLNDHSGSRDKNGNVSDEKAASFRKGYHDFLTTLRTVYPGVRIVAVSPFPEWIRKNIRQVVDEEKQIGKKDIDYATYDEFPGGYVANGHPTVATHQKMADQLIAVMDSLKIFPVSLIEK